MHKHNETPTAAFSDHRGPGHAGAEGNREEVFMMRKSIGLSGPQRFNPLPAAVATAAFVAAMAGLGCITALAAERVDFEKDVQPILQESCLDCHGPSKQKGDMRLDRRSSALKAFARRVVPHNSANSMVYQRLVGTEYGSQMPPTAELAPDKIATLKAWIDQGAEWPEALANEQELPPLHPKAVAMVEILRRGDLASFMAQAEREPQLLNARGPEGSTPFMYAALYCDAAALSRLLQLGADPNLRNDANATALMWAARDFSKLRVLVEHGADVNAKSSNRRTPLMIAARRPGAAGIVKYLLDHAADPNPNAKPVSESSPLLEALTAGDEETVKLLIRRGADAKATGEWGLVMAVTTGCAKGLEQIAAQMKDTDVFTIGLGLTAVLGNSKAVRLMLDRGADVNAVDPFGRTPLMYAAISDLLPVDTVKLLIERGADVNAASKHTRAGDAGLTVLDIARRNGPTPVVDLLLKHGARGSEEAPRRANRKQQPNTLEGAIRASLPLLQDADAKFSKGAGCTSCHNNSMQAMTVGLARSRGIRVDEALAAAQVTVNLEELESARDKLHQGYYITPVGDMFTDFVLGYQLVGLHAEHCPPDLNTDAAAFLIQSRQRPNGEWPYPHADTRPPICADYIGQTAVAMRALQCYTPKGHEAQFAKSIRLAAGWLARAKAYHNEDRAWRLTGLVWAGAEQAVIQKALREVLASQKPEGGWSDLPSMPSTPYATARSLVALRMGGLPASDPACKRGISYLLATQEADGSWFTRTRALGFQPYFDAGFPHQYDQWVSAAATSWATMALTLSLPERSLAAESGDYRSHYQPTRFLDSLSR
jgi:ankyrin repeat protein